MEINAKELKVGMRIKREWWPVYRTVIEIEKEENTVLFNDGWKGALVGTFTLEPNAAKIGDIITDGHGTYSVYEVDDTGTRVRLQNMKTLIKLNLWFFLPDEPHWFINGVKCSEFFGNGAAQQPAPIPVDVPKRKKRIYNA